MTLCRHWKIALLTKWLSLVENIHFPSLIKAPVLNSFTTLRQNIYNITSASGLIRIINAYYLALFETCLFYSDKTKHPGFLVIDEPRQQNLDLESFKKLTEIYVEICNKYKDKSQIIFASGNRGTFKTSQIKVELGKTNYLIKKL